MHSTSFVRATATTVVRRALRYALVAGLAVALTSCGLQKLGQNGHQGGVGLGSGTGSRPGNGARHHHPRAVRKGTKGRKSRPVARACGPAAIRVKLDARSMGVAAGSELLPLDFTNVSASRCRLAGYPEVAAITRSGKQIGAAATIDRALAPRAMVLVAGSTAHIWLRLVDVMNLPSSRCRPVSAAGLRVWLPGHAASTVVRRSVVTCSKRVRGTDILMIEPFRPGQAQPGTAQ